MTADAPAALYDGASKAVVRCSNGKVIAVQFEAPKGGLGSEGSRSVYANLSKKYKLIAGGAMPQSGNGYVWRLAIENCPTSIHRLCRPELAASSHQPEPEITATEPAFSGHDRHCGHSNQS